MAGKPDPSGKCYAHTSVELLLAVPDYKEQKRLPTSWLSDYRTMFDAEKPTKITFQTGDDLEDDFKEGDDASDYDHPNDEVLPPSRSITHKWRLYLSSHFTAKTSEDIQ